MNSSRFSAEQIACALGMADSGTPVVAECRQIGVLEAAFYTWKKCGEVGVSELRNHVHASLHAFTCSLAPGPPHRDVRVSPSATAKTKQMRSVHTGMGKKSNE